MKLIIDGLTVSNLEASVPLLTIIYSTHIDDRSIYSREKIQGERIAGIGSLLCSCIPRSFNIFTS